MTFSKSEASRQRTAVATSPGDMLASERGDLSPAELDGFAKRAAGGLLRHQIDGSLEELLRRSYFALGLRLRNTAPSGGSVRFNETGRPWLGSGVASRPPWLPWPLPPNSLASVLRSSSQKPSAGTPRR